MTTIIDGSLGITTPMYGGSIASNAVTPVTGFKNRLINGNMLINQRALGTVTVNSSGLYTIDRWQANQTAAGKFSVQQSSTAPAGFTNSYLATSLSSYSVSSSDIFFFQQNIEGYNIADLAWGTANAKTVTLSFQVQSSLTGTFGGAIANATQDYCYPFSYSIPVANTWTTISITIAGPTAGTWLTTNGLGAQIIFGLGGGSGRSATAGTWTTSGVYTATGATSVVGTSGATFYITGVQLEVGTAATSFDYRAYGTELALCQRYFQRSTAVTGYANSSSSIQAMATFFVQMRATPTITNTGTIQITDGAVNSTSTSSPSSTFGSPTGTAFNMGGFTANLTTHRPFIQDGSGGGSFSYSAEL